MTRAVKIDTEGNIYETNIRDLMTLFGRVDNLQMDRPTPLQDAFTDLDGSVVMLTDSSATAETAAWNQKASVLVAPQRESDTTYVRGDAYFVGEGLTAEGYSILDLPERVGEGDIRELVERFEKR